MSEPRQRSGRERGLACLRRRSAASERNAVLLDPVELSPPRLDVRQACVGTETLDVVGDRGGDGGRPPPAETP
jgi:hypothetical protein